MNQLPQIFQQLEHVTSQKKLELIQKLSNQQHIKDQSICPHTVSLQGDSLIINPIIHQCNCFQNLIMRNPFIQSIILLLFTFLSNDQNLSYYQNEANNSHIKNRIIKKYFNKDVKDQQQFRRNLQQYKVFETQQKIEADADAERLSKIEKFAKENSFEDQISFSILKFSKCSLKLVDLFNGQITANSFGLIQNGYIKLLEFFLKASENPNLKLYPVCIHNVNLGGIHVTNNDNEWQELQTSQSNCNQNCPNLEICQSFGSLLQDILRMDPDNEQKYSDLASRIISGQIYLLKLIKQFLNQQYVDEVVEIDLTILDYQPISRRIIKNINTHLDVEIDLYKIYFIRKTFSILANLVIQISTDPILANLDIQQQTDDPYNQILELLNIVENIYFQQSKQFLENYQSFQHRDLFIEKLNQIKQETSNSQWLQNQEVYSHQLELLIGNQVRIQQFLDPLIIFEQLQFRICCCFYSQFFFSQEHIIQNMEVYLQITSYASGIQFRKFEQFLENLENQHSISQMYMQLINYVQYQVQQQVQQHDQQQNQQQDQQQQN